MKGPNSYVYFAFYGDSFDPGKVTEQLNILPTKYWLKNQQNENGIPREFSFWQLSSQPDYEALNLNRLVDKIVSQLENKVEIINQLKSELGLTSVLQIVLEIDINPNISAPFLGHDSRIIAFLHNTQTTTDLDIYPIDSSVI